MSGGYSEPDPAVRVWGDAYDKRWPLDTSPPDYADLAPCGRCGKDVVLDHDPPCPHSYVACPECTHTAVCVDCRRDAFLDMCANGEYDPRADILIDHTAPPARDRIAENGGYWWDGAFVPVPKKEKGA